MARPPINTPNELRRRIQKCNHSIGKLMHEMAAFRGTDYFIDWTDLIGRLKTYRDKLEQELVAKNGGKAAVADLAPTPAPDPDEYRGPSESDSDEDDEISY